MENEEIKEILDKWQGKDGAIKVNLSLDGIRQLNDYITTLQEENEKLRVYLKPEYIVDKIKSIEEENESQKDLIKRQSKRNSRQRLANTKQQELILKLQEENQKLKKENEYSDYCDEELRKKITNLEYKIETLEDYKSRCEKGIEYNSQIIKDTKDFYRPTEDIIYSGDTLIDIATNNINILQNGSEKDV